MADKNFSEIKNKLIELNEKSNIIHVDINAKRKSVTNAKSTIVGIYDNFVCVKSNINNYTEDFTISYVDLLIRKIVIRELE